MFISVIVNLKVYIEVVFSKRNFFYLSGNECNILKNVRFGIPFQVDFFKRLISMWFLDSILSYSFSIKILFCVLSLSHFS